jgi:hypothetical protein
LGNCIPGVPHGILHVYNPILYENEFQNPQIFQQTIMSVFFPSNQLYKGYDESCYDIAIAVLYK